MDATDQALLREFATRRCEASFHRLVERHLALVYSVAERVTGDRGLAEEVAQSTFATLAEKSAGFDADTVIAGWLYHTARNLALTAVRSEVRRRQREQLAATMNTAEPGPNVVADHLEAAMDRLPPADRDALVLRFFEERNLRDVGRELGLSEDAARMRVNRALEKLRGVFGKLGITGSAAWLGTTLTTGATASVPAGLGATITTSVLGGTAVAAATTAFITETTATTMNLFNLKTAAAILGAAAVTGSTTYLVQEREADRLRADHQALQETHGKLATDQRETLAMVQFRDEQIELLKRDLADLPRLRGEIDALRREEARADESRLSEEKAAQRIAELTAQNTALTNRLNRSLTASWVYERDQWQNSGQAEPLDAFQTFLWASSTRDQEALNNVIHLADDVQSDEDRERLINQLLPREQPPATTATRVKIFWMTGPGEGEHPEKSLTALEESSFVERPLETREYLVRWDLVQIDGQWRVFRKRYL